MATRVKNRNTLRDIFSLTTGPNEPGLCTAVGTRPWTNQFMSASTTIVSSSSQSHMVDPDWIHILGKQRLPCVKGKVTVYVTCQCSENRCFWRAIDHKYQAPCYVAWCTVLFRSILTYHVSNKFSPGSV